MRNSRQFRLYFREKCTEINRRRLETFVSISPTLINRIILSYFSDVTLICPSLLLNALLISLQWCAYLRHLLPQLREKCTEINHRRLKTFVSSSPTLISREKLNYFSDVTLICPDLLLYALFISLHWSAYPRHLRL